MPEFSESESVSKLDAARRQLSTAIELWFNNKDQVSILTLSYASYEIIHVISKARGRLQPLLLDTPMVPLQFRKLLISHIKKVPNFFKHADRDPEGIIELKAVMPEIFFMFSILGLQSMGIPSNDYELAFSWWFNLNNPHMLTQYGREVISRGIPVEMVAEIKRWRKSEFFAEFLQARRTHPHLTPLVGID